jgi:HSP20 family protein
MGGDITMLMRFDPFREVDRLTQQVLGNAARPAVMPMDAYRQGDEFWVQIDLPGIDPSTIELTVDQNVLTVGAERSWTPTDGQEVIAAERPQGRFSRQLFLGDGLDADHIDASYNDGVLSVCLPVAERAKPRRVEISRGNGKAHAIAAGSREAEG